VLHPLAKEIIKPDEVYLYWHMVTVHSLPFLTVFTNLIISRTVFIPSHCVYVMGLAIAYSCMNYVGCLYRGHPLYPFLKWEDINSILFCMVMAVFGGVLAQISCMATSVLKKKPTQYGKTDSSKIQ
jgi:hypothetical protein